MNAVPVPDEAASVRRGLRRLQRLARYVRPYWQRATVGIVAMLVATGAGLAGPYLAKLAIDDAIVAGRPDGADVDRGRLPDHLDDRLRRPGRADVPDRATPASAC